MRLMSYVVAAIAVLFPIGYTASAQDEGPVVVARPVTFANWSKSVTRNIERHLIYPRPFSNETYATGIVQVTFMCNEDGRPGEVVLFRRSGDRQLDNAALRAVSRVKSLHPMPIQFGARTRFQANVLFATNQWDYDRQLAILHREAAVTNARHMGERPVALTIGSRAATGS